MTRVSYVRSIGYSSTFWNIIKDGAKMNVEDKVVNILPKGTIKDDFSGWQAPVSYQEKYDELSFLFKSELAVFTLRANWEYNGQYIANFDILEQLAASFIKPFSVVAGSPVCPALRLHVKLVKSIASRSKPKLIMLFLQELAPFYLFFSDMWHSPCHYHNQELKEKRCIHKFK